MKVIWLDRDGYTEKIESLSTQQIKAKIGPYLSRRADSAGMSAVGIRRYCAAVNAGSATFTVYSRGGSWCRDHKEQCRGNGCTANLDVAGKIPETAETA
jgi:hypothetical protein